MLMELRTYPPGAPSGPNDAIPRRKTDRRAAVCDGRHPRERCLSSHRRWPLQRTLVGPVAVMPAAPLTSEGVSWIDPAIGVGARSRRHALAIGRELAVSRISPDSPLQAVAVLRCGRGARQHCNGQRKNQTRKKVAHGHHPCSEQGRKPRRSSSRRPAVVAGEFASFPGRRRHARLRPTASVNGNECVSHSFHHASPSVTSRAEHRGRN